MECDLAGEGWVMRWTERGMISMVWKLGGEMVHGMSFDLLMLRIHGRALGYLRKILLGLVFVPAAFSQNLDSLQKNFVAMKYGMFLHFNMGTYQMKEYADPNLDPDLFNPDSLDCGQWADAAKAAGMKYMVLTVKHIDGFCLWNSAYTTHDVGSSAWRQGKGNVVKEFVDSCRSRGLAVGIYYCFWDQTHADDGDTTYIKNQLKELLTDYGPISLLWLDGWGWQIPYVKIPYETIRKTIKSIQPNCLLINNNQEHDLARSEIVEWEKGGHQGTSIPDNNLLPSEMCETVSAKGKWFYAGQAEADNLYSAEVLTGLLKACNTRNANFLLDVAPTPHGKIPASQVARIRELGLAPSGIEWPRPQAWTEGSRSGRSYSISIPGTGRVMHPTALGESLIDIRGRQFGWALTRAAAASAAGKN